MGHIRTINFHLYFNKSLLHYKNLKTTMTKITIAKGDGIGPEIIAKTADKMRDEIAAGRLEFMVIGSAEALDKACVQVGLKRETLPLSMIDVGPVEGEIKTGEISAVGGEWAYRAVKRAARRPDVEPFDVGSGGERGQVKALFGGGVRWPRCRRLRARDSRAPGL